MTRTAPDGGSAVGIWGPDFDEPGGNCADCGDPIWPSMHMCLVEAWERFEALLCDDCFEARCEVDEPDELDPDRLREDRAERRRLAAEDDDA